MRAGTQRAQQEAYAEVDLSPLEEYNGLLALDYDDTMAPTEEIAMRASQKIITREVIQPNDVPEYTEADYLEQFTGSTFEKTAKDIAAEFGFTLEQDRLNELVKVEMEAVMTAFGEELQPSAGIMEALELFSKHSVLMAVVSSSAGPRLEKCLVATAQDAYIPKGKVFSAQTSLPTPTPKPDPAIYLHALKECGLEDPANSIAVEDSRSGALSASQAGFRTVGYVGALPADKHEERAQLLFENGAEYVYDDHLLLPRIVLAYHQNDRDFLGQFFSKDAWKK